MDMRSAEEKVTGRILDANSDLRHSFGDYVQLGDAETSNDMEERVRGAIALAPVGNVEGSWHYLVLKSWNVVQRNGNAATPLPIPSEVIEYINSKSSASKRAKPRDYVKLGLWRGRDVAEVDSDSDDDDDNNDDEGDDGIIEQYLPEMIVPQQVDEVDDDGDAMIGEDLFEADQDDASVAQQAAAEQVMDEVQFEDGQQQEQAQANEGPEHLDQVQVDEGPDELGEDADGAHGAIDADAAGGEAAHAEGAEGEDPIAPAVPPAQQLGRGARQHQPGRWAHLTGRGTREYDRIVSNSVMLAADEVRLQANKQKHMCRIVCGDDYYSVYHLTVTQAIKQRGYAAIQSAVKEIMQLDDMNTFEGRLYNDLNPEQQAHIITSSMFLKDKFSPQGEFEKFKARLVAGGHLQDRSVYSVKSAPTVNTTSVFAIAGIAGQEGRAVAKADFPSAFLHSHMPDDQPEVIVRLNKFETKVLVAINPEYKKFVRKDGTCLVKLNRALYGCIQSARLWYEKLSVDLIDMGFAINPQDICVFNRTEADGSQTTLTLHVDDLFVTAKTETHIDTFFEQLLQRYPTLSIQRGRVIDYLGMTFDFQEPGKVRVTMKQYVNELLDFCEPLDGEADTPARPNLFKVDTHSDNLTGVDKEYFHSATAKLLYLGKRVRPDILTAVSFLVKRVQKPTVQDKQKLRRVVQYIRKTRDFGIVIQADKILAIYAFVDASYGVHEDFKSHTGVVVGFGRGPILAKSSTQKLNAKSSTEAELIGLSDSTGEILWLRDFLIAQGYIMSPATVYQDNMSTIAMIKNGRPNSTRSKHIGIRFFFVADRVQQKEIKIEYMSTNDMLADILTKPLQGNLFVKMRNQLLNWT